MSRVLFRNIGTLISGDIGQPILEASSIVVEDGRISELGSEPSADVVIDVRGATVTPRLWDAHHHPYYGEYTPRAEAYNAITKTLRAGTTAVVSAGPRHQPGSTRHRRPCRTCRPTPIVGRPVEASPGRRWYQSAGDCDGQGLAEGAPAGDEVLRRDGSSREWSDRGRLRRNGRCGVKRIKFLRPIPYMKECQQYCQWCARPGHASADPQRWPEADQRHRLNRTCATSTPARRGLSREWRARPHRLPMSTG